MVQPDDRKILKIIDLEEKSGKSQFYKWIVNRNMESVGRLTYISSAQLLYMVVRPKKIYIIDLTSVKGKYDSGRGLLSVLEGLKFGLVINAMYG